MSKKKKSPPKVSPLATIKFRVDEFLANAATASGDKEYIRQNLDALAQGLKPEQMFSFLLFALESAPPSVVESVGNVAPEWIKARGFESNLKGFLLKESLSGQANPVGNMWLQALDIDISTDVQARQKAAEDLFVEAWAHDETEWQRSVYALWHTDKRKYQQHGFAMLIDRNDEWDGAIKDFFLLKPHNVEKFKAHTRKSFNGRQGPAHKPRSASELKEILYQAFQDCKRMGLRPPKDFTMAMDEFWKFWMALPDTPLTADFSREEFERICFVGRTAESLIHKEQTVGRVFTTEDGVVVHSSPDLYDTLVNNDFKEPLSGLGMLQELQKMLDYKDKQAEKRYEELENMTTEDLWQCLREAGFTQSEKELRQSVQNAFSLEKFALDCVDISNPPTADEENDIIMGIPLLCRRLFPDMPFGEMLIADLGDAHDELQNLEGAEGVADKELEDCWRTWSVMKDFIARRNAFGALKPIRSFDDVEDTLYTYDPILAEFSFFTHYRYVAEEVAIDFPELIPKARALFHDILETLPDSEQQESKLEVLFGLASLLRGENNFAEADALCERILEEYPSNAAVYVNWSELYSEPRSQRDSSKIAKAREILQRGLADPELDDVDFIEECLESLED